MFFFTKIFFGSFQKEMGILFFKKKICNEFLRKLKIKKTILLFFMLHQKQIKPRVIYFNHIFIIGG